MQYQRILLMVRCIRRGGKFDEWRYSVLYQLNT